MRWRVHPVHFKEKVSRIMEAAREDQDIPPLIVHYLFSEADGTPEFELNEGNDRFEAYKRLGVASTEVIVWITERAELDDFMTNYGHFLEVADA